MKPLLDFFRTVILKAKDVLDEKTDEYLDIRVTQIINDMTLNVDSATITPEDRLTLYEAWKTKDQAVLQTAIDSTQTNFRMKFYEQSFKPLEPQIHRLRYIALGLNSDNYNNYVMKISALIEAFGQLNVQISEQLIRETIVEFMMLAHEEQEALKKYGITAKPIEE